MIKMKNVSKSFTLGEETIKAVDNISLEVKEKDFLAIVGPSGSGKSTLMNIIGLLDVPDTGEYFLDQVDIKKASDDELAILRNQKIGFVFQNFNLLGKMTALENVEVPLIYNGKTEEEARLIATRALEKVGLKNRINHLPNQLSGGQQQRVAIARAISCNPDIILADEPTGALDSKTGMDIMNLLKELNEQGQTIILITHDMNIAKKAKRIVRISDGKLYEEEKDDESKKHPKRIH